MARKVAWKDLPKWAKDEIKKAGHFGITQITRDGGSLSISGGIARYNGVEVAPEGVEVSTEERQEEVIVDTELPAWARTKVLNTSAGGQVQMNNGGDVLQIAGGVAFYNGKRVARSGGVIESVPDRNSPEFKHNLGKAYEAILRSNPTIESGGPPIIESGEDQGERKQRHQEETINEGDMVLAYPAGKPVWMTVTSKILVNDGKVTLYELVTAEGRTYYTTAAFLWS